MNPIETYFAPIVGKRRRNNRIAGVAILLLGFAVLAWELSLDTGDPKDARMLAAAFIAIPTAFAVLVAGAMRNRALSQLAEPEDIVWYYGVNRSGHVHAIMIGFANGSLHRFPLPLISVKEGFSQEAFELLRSAAPAASEGHTEERRKTFRANPRSLKGQS